MKKKIKKQTITIDLDDFKYLFKALAEASMVLEAISGDCNLVSMKKAEKIAWRINNKLDLKIHIYG